jgi:hypothetical protein
MRELGRLGGRAIPKAKRSGGERVGYRDHLRRELDPSEITAAIKTGLASPNERDRLAAAKLALAELYEPAAKRTRQAESDVAGTREALALRIDAIAQRKVVRELVNSGLIRPGAGQPFEGVVKFGLRELAEWVGQWTPRPVKIYDVTCAACGTVGVRLVAKNVQLDERGFIHTTVTSKRVDGGQLYCATCRPPNGLAVDALV